MENEQNRLEEIPSLFHQDSEKKAFQVCTFCNNSLQNAVPYMIEKSIKVNRENGIRYTLYEYAICMKCSQKKMESMSKESLANIKNYMEQNLHEIQSLVNYQNLEDKLSKCPLTGKKISDLEEYNVVGQFVNDKLLYGYFPMAFSAEIGEQMQELLSEATKKEFDDFMDTVKGIPPELRSLFKTKRPLLV